MDSNIGATVKSNEKAYRLLKKAWSRLREKDPRSWSLRGLARETSLSPGYLSKLLSGQKPLSKAHCLKILKVLKIDDLTKMTILNSFEMKVQKTKVAKTKTPELESYEVPQESSEWLLARWHRLVLLDLMTTDDFKSCPKWFSARLGVPVSEIEKSLHYLIDAGLAEQDQAGNYRKKHLRIRFPTSISKQVIREHHKAQMQRAIQELDQKTTPKDFNKRLIVGLSVACDPKRLNEIRDFLHIALYEAAERFANGSCLEVYQINLQLFPQTQELK